MQIRKKIRRLVGSDYSICDLIGQIRIIDNLHNSSL